MKRGVFYILALFLLVSCTEEIEIKNIGAQEKLVINGHFEPNENFEIFLSKSQNITGALDTAYITNAKCILLEDNISVGLFAYAGNGRYALNKSPDPGKVYNILVQNGQLKAEATDFLPIGAKIISLDTLTTIGVKGPGLFNMTIGYEKNGSVYKNYEIGVEVDIKKYSRVNGVIKDSIFETRALNLLTSDPQLLQNPNNTNFEQQYLFKDYFLSAAKTIQVGTYDLSKLDKDEVPVKLRITSISHSNIGYAFFNSFYNHQFYKNNPFALPVNVESNVLNGYGVFSGRVVSEYSIDF